MYSLRHSERSEESLCNETLRKLRVTKSIVSDRNLVVRCKQYKEGI